MAKLIVSPAHKRWVKQLFACGFQAAVNAAYGREAPFQRAWRYFSTLEQARVIRQWIVTLDDDEAIDIEDPHSGAPLFVAAERWGEFVAEAERLGLKKLTRPS